MDKSGQKLKINPEKEGPSEVEKGRNSAEEEKSAGKYSGNRAPSEGDRWDEEGKHVAYWEQKNKVLNFSQFKWFSKDYLMAASLDKEFIFLSSKIKKM